MENVYSRGGREIFFGAFPRDIRRSNRGLMLVVSLPLLACYHEHLGPETSSLKSFLSSLTAPFNEHLDTIFAVAQPNTVSTVLIEIENCFSADIEQRVAERCQLDEKYQDSEDRIEFSVKSDYVEDVLDFLEELPQSRIFRVNYENVSPEAHFHLRVAIPSLPHDFAATGWAELNHGVLCANFPEINYYKIFTSTLQATYKGHNGGKSADTNIVPQARFTVGASGFPSVIVEVG
ncbi:hypothetical protein E1B28_005593 [Marasmius oreades]|uniref:Uncharacterized protein n=1 Tax=Marasmius oreades TaxID=181124 RepID=A0A9P7S475_9AGAR|nr:uncharacterized protein E1B28_005593 [Marasmius oreades]KAG7094777.1 hypothetical protein E1B28_005593 [Marasmius oreades]